MKTIIYTPPESIENEIQIIGELLDAGADYLYIRKPTLDDFSLVDYMEEFDPKYYPKIVTTSLIITKEFDLGGYHFTRDVIDKNKQYNEMILQWLRDKNKVSSVSAHSLKDMKKYAGKFDHVIVSPVFKSISKGHQYDWDYVELEVILYESSWKTTFFAVGGIDKNNITEIKAMQFDGVGLLGALWKEPANAVRNFSKILNQVQDDKPLMTNDQ